MVICDRVLHAYGLIAEPAGDIGPAAEKPQAIFRAESAGLCHVAQHLHVGNKLAGFFLAVAEGAKLLLLALKVEKYLLSGKDIELAGESIYLLCYPFRVRQVIVPVKHILKEAY